MKLVTQPIDNAAIASDFPVHDLSQPDFDPPDCPAWARHAVPPEMQLFRGRNGMPPAYRRRTYALGMAVKGVDRYHANQFITYRPETSRYLYESYTPLNVDYQSGLLPEYEKLATLLTAGCNTQTSAAVALLRGACDRVKHPQMPPCGVAVAPDRALDDEALLASGAGWCNEQTRVFVRLCQVREIPARLVHLFYSDGCTGHCIAEFYAYGRWCMADVSWACVFPDENGLLQSAATCHDGASGQLRCGLAYKARFDELCALSDEALNLGSAEAACAWRADRARETPQSLADKLTFFALVNNPLPRSESMAE